MYPRINQQSMFEQIDGQINQLQQMKEQMRNQPSINQTFQLAPQGSMRFANTIDEVSREMVYTETPFFSKDLSVVWIKNPKNDIKTFELNEIVPKDDKDIQIEYLTSRLEELERKFSNEQFNTNVITTEDATDSSRDDETTRKSIKEVESSSVSRVSKSKAK